MIVNIVLLFLGFVVGACCWGKHKRWLVVGGWCDLRRGVIEGMMRGAWICLIQYDSRILLFVFFVDLLPTVVVLFMVLGLSYFARTLGTSPITLSVFLF